LTVTVSFAIFFKVEIKVNIHFRPGRSDEATGKTKVVPTGGQYRFQGQIGRGIS